MPKNPTLEQQIYGTLPMVNIALVREGTPKLKLEIENRGFKLEVLAE